MLDRMAATPIEPTDLSALLPDGAIPHHFYCPIFQDVMQDPVSIL